jgi:hypothetical protein
MVLAPLLGVVAMVGLRCGELSHPPYGWLFERPISEPISGDLVGHRVLVPLYFPIST